MSSTVELTYQDVAEHNTKKDIYVVIHDKIYDCTQFVDEHPYVYALPWECHPFSSVCFASRICQVRGWAEQKFVAPELPL